jgi:hypothetical protein
MKHAPEVMCHQCGFRSAPSIGHLCVDCAIDNSQADFQEDIDSLAQAIDHLANALLLHIEGTTEEEPEKIAQALKDMRHYLSQIKGR